MFMWRLTCAPNVNVHALAQMLAGLDVGLKAALGVAAAQQCVKHTHTHTQHNTQTLIHRDVSEV